MIPGGLRCGCLLDHNKIVSEIYTTCYYIGIVNPPFFRGELGEEEVKEGY